MSVHLHLQVSPSCARGATTSCRRWSWFAAPSTRTRSRASSRCAIRWRRSRTRSTCSRGWATRRSAAPTRAASPGRSRSRSCTPTCRSSRPPPQGVGSVLLAAVADHARAAGKQGLTVEVREDDGESLAWVERRGFEEVERQKGLELCSPTSRRWRRSRRRASSSCRGLPSTSVACTPSASRPGRTSPGSTPSTTPSFEQWRSFEIERPSRRPELCFVALADGEVVGFASVDVFGESDTGWHGLTACRARVARPRRGVRAEALADRGGPPSRAPSADDGERGAERADAAAEREARLPLRAGDDRAAGPLPEQA